VIWPTRDAQRQKVSADLVAHAANTRPLPGILDPRARDTLALQIVASVRREDYYRLIQARPISPRRADPHDALFNPERAVALHVANGNLDEAAWLVFLMTHFAKPADTGWLRLRDVYGLLGNGVWDWPSVTGNPASFDAWLTANWTAIRGKFGNHRKYESLRPGSNRPTGFVVSEYVRMIGAQGHQAFFQNVLANGPNDRFGAMYGAVNLPSFGRLAKFDYLMLLSRYGIVPMQPLSAYLEGATGPSRGANLLFTGLAGSNTSSTQLQQMLDDLDNNLHVGMAVLEDALCNWQKQPLHFVHFRG
jgi:hypothetical protein